MSSLKARAVLIGGLSMVRSFANLGIPTIVISRYARDVGRYSRYCNDWRTTFSNTDWDEARFLATLTAIAEEGPDKPVLYYGDDPMLLFIAKHRDTLQRYYRFTMPEPETFQACYDKVAFSTLAAKSKLPFPKTVTWSAGLNSALIAQQVGFPCVFKPATRAKWFQSESIRQASQGAQKVLVVNSLEECDRALNAMQNYSDNYIVQDYIQGNEANIYSFHTYAPKNGNKSLWYVGKKIRTFPAVAGESSYVELVDNPDVAALGLNIVDKLGLIGPVKIDFKKDSRSGEYLTLEINLRFSLWNQLGSYCGVNLPLAAYLDNNHLQQPAVAPCRTGVAWLHFGRDLRCFTRDYYPSRQLSIPSWLTSLCRPKVYSIFCWKDPLPFIMHGLGSLKRVPQKIIGKTS